MANALIKFTQGALNPAAGLALIGVTGTVVACTNGDNTNVISWLWEMIDVPPGSAVPIGTMSLTNSTSFTPDKTAGYLVRLTTTDNIGNTYVDERAFAVPQDTIYNRIIAPFRAMAPALNFSGQLRGWAKYVEPYLNVLDRLRDVGPAAPANGNVLTWVAVNNRYEPAAIPPGGITQLTGDVTAGPGSGVQAAVVARINGSTVPAGGALTTGNVLQVTGASALGYGPVNLAGGVNYVTGVLPVINQAAQAMAGDVTGTTAASVVASATGVAGVFAMATTAAAITWAALTTSPTVTQSTALSDVATKNITLQAQSPYASATGTNRDAGDIIVNTPASVGGSVTKYGGLQVQYGGTTLVRMGAFQGTSTYGAIWFKDAGAPSTTNFALLGDAASTYVNTTVLGGTLYFGVGGAYRMGMNTSVFSMGTTYANPQYTFDFSATAVQHFTANATSAAIVWDAPAGNTLPGNLIIRGQAPNAGATGANVHYGDVWIDSPQDIGGGSTKNGGLVVSYNNGATPIVRIGQYVGATYGAIWFKDAGAPSSTNWAFLGEATSSYFNAPSSTMYFGVGASYRMVMNTSVFSMGMAYTNPQYTFDFSATAVQHFGASATTAKIIYDQSTTGAGAVFTLQGQAAKATSGLAGGNLVLGSGAGDGAGANGKISFQSGTWEAASIDPAFGVGVFGGNSGSSAFKVHVGPLSGFEAINGAIWILASATGRNSTNPVLYSGGTSCYFNAPSAGGSIGFIESGANVMALITRASGWVWDSTQVATFSQTLHATTPHTMTFQAQNVTTGTGSDLALTSGTGSVANGNVLLKSGASTIATASASGLLLSAGLNLHTTTVNTTPYTIDASGFQLTILVDCSGGARTLTLPAPVDGRTILITDSTFSAATNNVTIAPHGAEKIGGTAGNKVMSATGFSITLISNGTDWFIWSC